MMTALVIAAAVSFMILAASVAAPFLGPCKRDATAEDFLCDYCREGCAIFTIGSGPTNVHVGFRGDSEGLFIDATNAAMKAVREDAWTTIGTTGECDR